MESTDEVPEENELNEECDLLEDVYIYLTEKKYREGPMQNQLKACHLKESSKLLYCECWHVASYLGSSYILSGTKSFLGYLAYERMHEMIVCFV